MIDFEIFNLIKEAVLIMDDDKQIVFISETFKDIFPKDLDDVRHLDELILRFYGKESYKNSILFSNIKNPDSQYNRTPPHLKRWHPHLKSLLPNQSSFFMQWSFLS